VLPNYNDETFIKVLLDPSSQAFFAKNLHKLSGTSIEQIKQVELTKTLIWRAFYDMVRDGKLTTLEYKDIFIGAILLENDDDLVQA